MKDDRTRVRTLGVVLPQMLKQRVRIHVSLVTVIVTAKHGELVYRGREGCGIKWYTVVHLGVPLYVRVYRGIPRYIMV